jgi:hypothetical protein
LVSIRIRLAGGKEAAGELKLVSTAEKEVGTSALAAGAASTRGASGISRVLGRMKGAWLAVKRVARFAAVGVAAGAVALGLWGKKAVSSTVELAKATAGLQNSFGLTTETASAFLSLAKVRGADYAKTTLAVKSFGTQLRSAATGTESAIGVFRKLGFSQADIQKGLKNSDWALAKAAEGFGNLGTGMLKGVFGAKLFGKGYATLFPLLREGKKEWLSQIATAKEYGAVLHGSAVDSALEFAEAQRKVELGNIGLQITFTEKVLPSLIKVMDWFGKLAKVINDPKLNLDEKADKIEKMVSKILDSFVDIAAVALPKIDEVGLKIGAKFALAIWDGFKKAGLGEKLLISVWLLKFMGGGGLIRGVAGKAGKAIARGLLWALLPALAEEFAVTGSIGLMLKARWASMGRLSGRAFTVGVVAGVVIGGVALGWQLGRILEEKTHGAFHRWAINAAQNFVNGLVAGINKGLDEANIWAFLGVNAPNIGEVNLHDTAERVAGGEHITHHPRAPGAGPPPGSEGPGITKSLPRAGGFSLRRRGEHPAARPRGRSRAPLPEGRGTQGLTRLGPRGGRRGRERQPIQLQVDGRTLAEVVVDYQEDDEARE